MDELLRSAEKQMKIIRYLLTAILILTALSCERSSDQLSGLGKIRSPQGNWKIELLEHDPGLRIKEINNDSVIQSPVKWTNSKDAFVFVDSDERIWAFNGSDQTFIFEKISAESYAAWDLEGCKRPIPSQFLKRLPAALISQAEQAVDGNPH